MLIFFAYWGYPISLFLYSLRRSSNTKKANISPSVTIIIAAYNEEKQIAKKLDNTLALTYPKHKLQIIVASDGSTDKTNIIVDDYAKQGVELIVTDRKGKENAQKHSIQQADGDILVFTDAGIKLDKDGLEMIVKNFADQSVGCVSSEDKLIDGSGVPSGEGVYVKYEMWLRRLESKANSLVGLSGSFFAVRKEMCQEFRTDMDSDFQFLLNCIQSGLKGISDPSAIGYYRNTNNETNESERKLRTVIRGLTLYFNHLEFLNFIKFGFFSYQFFCHKLLRWIVPLFLITTFISNIAIVHHSLFYSFSLIIQAFWYSVAFIGFQYRNLLKHSYLKIPYYFTSVNYSILRAWFHYLNGKRMVTWKPTEREPG